MLVDGAWCEVLRLHVVGAGGGGGFASLRLACRLGSEGGVSGEAGGLITRSGVYPSVGMVTWRQVVEFVHPPISIPSVSVLVLVVSLEACPLTPPTCVTLTHIGHERGAYLLRAGAWARDASLMQVARCTRKPSTVCPLFDSAQRLA